MPTSFMPRCLIHSTHWCKKKGTLAGVGRSMESKLASLGIKTCGDLQYMIMAKLQKEFGPKTGQMLYRFCHGLDDRPVRTEKERKSVSAEINYGIRFTQPKEAAFLLSLSEEIQRRLEATGMKGTCLTLKIVVQKPGAPVETAKFGGHGICDNIARTVTLDQATDNGKIIGKAMLNMFHTMKLNISDMRGVGILINQLVPADPNTSTCPSRPSIQSSHFPRGSHSVRDIFQVQKAMKSTEEEHKEELALSCHIFLHICRPVSVLILTRLSLQGNGMVCILLSVCSQDLTLV
ncbi:DNA repair protein REV1-like [Callithrix jacchus]